MTWSERARAAPRRLAGAAVALGALLLLREGSLVALPRPDANHAWVRLSWSARPERVETCRRLSDEEMAARPQHMRLRLECVGTFAHYLLQVTVDDARIVRDTVRGGGFRRDRPMHVLREAPLDPGTRRVRAELERVDSLAHDAAAIPDPSPPRAPAASADREREALEGREARERDERTRRAAESIPSRMTLDTTVTLRAGDVLLITYDEQRRALVARSSER